MSSNNFTQGHLVKRKWLVANVTAVGSLDRLSERAIFGLILVGRDFGWTCFCPNQAVFVVAEPLCGVGTSS